MQVAGGGDGRITFSSGARRGHRPGRVVDQTGGSGVDAAGRFTGHDVVKPDIRFMSRPGRNSDSL
jgi:hypothetical protein